MLVSSDLAAASNDQARAADLLAESARSSAQGLWPTDWLSLARRDESRGDFATASDRYAGYVRSLDGTGEDTRWVEPRIKMLNSAARAGLAGNAAPEARLAMADGRVALAHGDRKFARERFHVALRLDSRYADAAIAAGALDAQEGRLDEAVREYRMALAADPERAEAMVPLSNLLWEHPDRATKAESLILLDRAAEARPELPSLLRRSAERWDKWGDPKAALDRLDQWRAGASPSERRETDRLREELVSRAPKVEAAAASAAAAQGLRREVRPGIPRREAALPSSGTSGWLWAVGVAALVAIGAAVLARRRRDPIPEEPPAAPVPANTAVAAAEISRILQAVAAEKQFPVPPLATKGFPEDGRPAWIVRVPPPVWEAMWHALFAASLSGLGVTRGAAPRLALFGSLVHEDTGLAVRFALADNAPDPLTTEMIRSRSAGREWAAADELVRAHGGTIAVSSSIDRQFTKRLVIEIPALEISGL